MLKSKFHKMQTCGIVELYKVYHRYVAPPLWLQVASLQEDIKKKKDEVQKGKEDVKKAEAVIESLKTDIEGLHREIQERDDTIQDKVCDQHVYSYIYVL